MPPHHPVASALSVRLAHLNGLIRKPKVTQAKAAKASAPRPPERSTRPQAATAVPASRFLHLNANLPPVRPQDMATQRAAEPTAQELAARILSAGKPGAATAPRTEAQKIAARVLATARKLQPGRF